MRDIMKVSIYLISFTNDNRVNQDLLLIRSRKQVKNRKGFVILGGALAS